MALHEERDLSTEELASVGSRTGRPAPDDTPPPPEVPERPVTGERLAGDGDPTGPVTAGPAAATPAVGVRPGADTPRQGEPPAVTLLEPAEADAFRHRWEAIQVSFVDEPQDAVRDADRLVAEVMQRVARGLADQKGRLESQWSGGGGISTEDLRDSLKQYRSFFQALLSR